MHIRHRQTQKVIDKKGILKMKRLVDIFKELVDDSEVARGILFFISEMKT